jgi:hypothetical protein
VTDPWHSSRSDPASHTPPSNVWFIQNYRYRYRFTAIFSKIARERPRKRDKGRPCSTIDRSKSFPLSVDFDSLEFHRVSELLRCIGTNNIGFCLQILVLRRLNLWTDEGSENSTLFMRYFRSLPSRDWNAERWLLGGPYGTERWCQFRARREELILTPWHGFIIHEEKQNRGYCHRFKWHNLTVRWIYGFRGRVAGEIRGKWMTFWILTHSPDWLCAADIRLSFHVQRWTLWVFEFRYKWVISIKFWFNSDDSFDIKEK